MLLPFCCQRLVVTQLKTTHRSRGSSDRLIYNMSENIEARRELVLENFLTDIQIQYIVSQCIADDAVWKLKSSEVAPVVDGIAGFLGIHLKAVLRIQVGEKFKNIHLFLKCKPVYNQAKTDFIDDNNFYRREEMMYGLIEKIHDDGPNPWCEKAYLYTDSILVMPDLSSKGYSTQHYLETLDHEHVIIATASIARFHAAFINYETKKSIDLKRPYRIVDDFGHLLTEPTSCDCQWLKASAQVSSKFLKLYSTKAYGNLVDVDSKLMTCFLQACASVKEYENSVNVLLHKDLWVNNIMFKYDKETPTNAILVDFQNSRYAPPAFDLMLFLYLTTDRNYREECETDIRDYYYYSFVRNLNEDSKIRLQNLGYDKGDFLSWCEKSRMFGMCLAASIYPFVLLDPKTAEYLFDNPETHEKYNIGDRAEPLLAYAKGCEAYKQRNLDICEEFAERYLLEIF